jgi:5'-nucleotidase
VAAYFTQYFGRILLKNQLPLDVNVLKVDIPANATRETAWRMTRVSRLGYYEPVPAPEKDWQKRRFLGYRMSDEPEDDTRTDVYGMRTGEFIAVCPVSLDLTSRIDLDEFEQQLKKDRFHPE